MELETEETDMSEKPSSQTEYSRCTSCELLTEFDQCISLENAGKAEKKNLKGNLTQTHISQASCIYQLDITRMYQISFPGIQARK